MISLRDSLVTEEINLPEDEVSLSLRRAYEGNEDAWSRVYEFVLKKANNLPISNRTGIEPEDIAQSALIKIFSSREKYDITKPAGRWIETILRNHFNDELRRILNPKRDLKRTIHLDDLPPLKRDQISREEPPSATIDEESSRRYLRREIEKLSPPLSETIEMIYYQRCSIRETARRLKICEGTVRSRIFEGHKVLKEAIDSDKL